MPHLFIPPKVAKELLEERYEYAAVIDRACHSDRVCEEWTRELRRLDPRMRMLRAPDCRVIGTPLVPNHYHLIRDNENAPPSVTPVRGPNGEFIYPPGNLLERLKAMDLWDARAVADRERQQQQVQASHDREHARHREDFDQDLVERVLAVTRTQVSTNRDTPWTQNNSGNARRDAGQRGRGTRP